MLVKVLCEKFRKKEIIFNEGLNVVLGDENASNSIGKSTLLMIIDFVFGGNDYLDKNSDAIEELGDHQFYFTMKFNAVFYFFSRETRNSNEVNLCDDKFTIKKKYTIDEYRDFLKLLYWGDNMSSTSFRSVCGLFSRIWGKDNLMVMKPFHIIQAESGKRCVERIVRTFDKYERINDLNRELSIFSEEQKAISLAMKKNIIPNINKIDYTKNQKQKVSFENEYEEIRINLEKFALNLNEIVNKEIIELKNKKDILLKDKLHFDDRMLRIDSNISDNKYIKSKHYKALLDLIPTVDIDKLEQIESFHDGMAKILKKEFLATKVDIQQKINVLNKSILEIDKEIDSVLKSKKSPSVIIDRVYNISKELERIKQENNSYDKKKKLEKDTKELKAGLKNEMLATLISLEKLINGKIREYINLVYTEEREVPALKLTPSGYTYEISKDSGTGKAYLNLIVLDLVMLSISYTPFLIHDSLLFKNIEINTVGEVIKLYNSQCKQSFIAIDEISKYGEGTKEQLLKLKVVSLDEKNTLFSKIWNKKNS